MHEWLVANRDALIVIGALFNSIGAVAAVVIFLLALVQYWRSEKWRKTEFIAQLYKDFSNNDACRCAMWMLDGTERTIFFQEGEAMKPYEYNFDILHGALRKYSDARPFSAVELHIRDTLDRFFIYLEQFDRAIENRLIHKDEVYPYFGYWIRRLNGQGDLPERIRLRVLEYMEACDYGEVRRFVERWSPAHRRESIGNSQQNSGRMLQSRVA
jgi:hypothetical protein